MRFKNISVSEQEFMFVTLESLEIVITLMERFLYKKKNYISGCSILVIIFIYLVMEHINFQMQLLKNL